MKELKTATQDFAGSKHFYIMSFDGQRLDVDEARTLEEMGVRSDDTLTVVCQAHTPTPAEKFFDPQTYHGKTLPPFPSPETLGKLDQQVTLTNNAKAQFFDSATYRYQSKKRSEAESAPSNQEHPDSKKLKTSPASVLDAETLAAQADSKKLKTSPAAVLDAEALAAQADSKKLKTSPAAVVDAEALAAKAELARKTHMQTLAAEATAEGKGDIKSTSSSKHIDNEDEGHVTWCCV